MTRGGERAVPSNRVLGITFGVWLTLGLLAQLNLQLTFAAVRHPVPLGSANLEADPAVVRGWYRLLMDQGTYLQMIRTELVDVPWAILLGVAMVSLCRFIAGMLRRIHPAISSWLFRWALLAVIGPAFDVVENCFSFAMLTDPFGFPDWFATAHVVASWLKIVFVAAVAIGGPTLTVIAVVTGRPVREAGDARQALPSR